MVTASKLRSGDMIFVKGEEKLLGRVRRIYPKAGTGVYQFTVDAEIVGEEEHLFFDHQDSVLLIQRREKEEEA